MIKKRFITALLIFCCWMLSFPAGPLTAETAASQALYIGSSKVEMTPPVGTPLAGYGKRRGKPSAGVHDPLYARALALSYKNETFIFVSADLVLIDDGLRKEVLKKIREKISFEENQLLLFATHTHSGSGAIGSRYWERFIMGKKQKSVFKKISSAIAQAALESLAQKIPVTAEYGEVRIDPLIQNRMDEKKSGPHFLRHLRFKTNTGNVAASLVFMAAHPTLLPASNMEFSADFSGALTQALDEKSPGSINVFVNGAAGDLRAQAMHFEDRYQKMQAYGFQLMTEMQKIPYKPVSFDGVWASEIQRKKLPRVKIHRGIFKVPSFIGGRIFPRHSTFHVIRMGSFLFLSFPGELSSEIGRSLEKQARALFLEPFIVGYAQDYIGYVVPKYSYQDTEQYESQASFYGSKMDFWTQSVLREMTLKLFTAEEKSILEKPGTLRYQENLPVLRLSGDAYHAGFEEGRLLRDNIRTGIDEIFAYFRKEVPIPGVNRVLIHVLANRAWKKMEPYISYEEYLQMKGIADGSGISLKTIKQIHALPEIYPALCANSAFWGKATQDGRLIALRNLDWNRKMGIHRHAAVKWISIPGQAAYANIGYAGFSGVLSGINEHGISVGQIGATSSDETMRGTPMPFVLRRSLAESRSLDDIKKIFQETPLTRGYNYVFSDAMQKKALVIETTAHHTAFFSDADPREKEIPYSLSLENAVFRGDPALDPVIRNLQTASGGNPKKEGLEFPTGSAYEIRYQKQGALIQKYYGEITPETAKSIAREIAPGSNIQSVVYAYPEFWVANAEEDKRAVEMNFVKFNLEELGKNQS